MKKLIVIFLFLLAFSGYAVSVIQTPSNILYFLNWGEYIDHELVAEFEKENNCQVIEEDVTSSEVMYQKITANTTSYDVAIPGDYTVNQLYKEGYLRQLDVNNVAYPHLANYRTMFSSDLSDLLSKYMVDETTGVEFNDCFCPYFWGAYCMIYSKRNPEVGRVISDNGLSALYDRGLYSSEVKIGMYDTARWIVASYLLSEGFDPNVTSLDGSKGGDIDQTLVKQIEAALKSARFDEFGNDSLKRNVASGSLDMCFTQLGDFFDAMYLVYSEGATSLDFSVSVPKTTAAFFDSMVIPSTSNNYELANKFIDFMMTPENAYQNAKAIGYSPTLKEVVSLYEDGAKNGEYYYGSDAEENSVKLDTFLSSYPMYLDPLQKTEKVYLLERKSNDYLTTCQTIFNSLA